MNIIETDRKHLWHPYSPMPNPLPVYPVKTASGVRLTLEDGRELVDGMASWWSAIHGYNHPVLNEAVRLQTEKMSHVMFGGLTHRPAAELASMLADLTPEGLDKVFLCDSGSVSVEVALKMAIQYWVSNGFTDKTKFLTVRNGYHGDTFGAMSVCDPVTGMHELFSGILPANFFAPAPAIPFDGKWDDSAIADFSCLISRHHKTLAAVILEPIVQGAGGMRFYSPEYLKRVRSLCDTFDVLLICDEIATGFGRTGKLFACEHAGITPDIMCLGKAMTGGYMTMAATLATERISDGLTKGSAGVFMHGPTFMGNPLAAATAAASINLLLSSPWESRVNAIENQMKQELEPCRNINGVADVRVLGGIGVVQLDKNADMAACQELFVESGVWIRPFGKLIYIMPPYIIESDDLSMLTRAMKEAARYHEGK